MLAPYLTNSRLTARAALLPLLAPLLAACGADPQDGPFSEYQDRLARTLGVTAAAPAPPALPLPPRSGRLQIDLPGGKLDTLDFLALTGCELQVTIGKRNSSLGRLAAPSQRLLLELEYLRLAPACIEAMRAEERTELVQLLQDALAQKKEQLPARIFNATLGSDEYRAFWRASRPAGEFPRVADQVAVSALKAINAQVDLWLAGDYRADDTAFEILLGEVAGGDGGAVLRALAHQSAWLGAADDMLARREREGPLCQPPIRDSAADILPNVVQKFFVQGIQPRAAGLNRRLHALEPPVLALEDKLEDVLPGNYRTWLNERNATLDAAGQAPKRHVAQVQALLAPCGGVPGAQAG